MIVEQSSGVNCAIPDVAIVAVGAAVLLPVIMTPVTTTDDSEMVDEGAMT